MMCLFLRRLQYNITDSRDAQHTNMYTHTSLLLHLYEQAFFIRIYKTNLDLLYHTNSYYACQIHKKLNNLQDYPKCSVIKHHNLLSSL